MEVFGKWSKKNNLLSQIVNSLIFLQNDVENTE